MTPLLNTLTDEDRQRIRFNLNEIGKKRRYADLYREIMNAPADSWFTRYMKKCVSELREKVAQQKTGAS